jgi:hypothetical protein
METSIERGRDGASSIGEEAFIKTKEIISFELLFFININIWIEFCLW